MGVVSLNSYRAIRQIEDQRREAERLARWADAAEAFCWDAEAVAALAVARDAGRYWDDRQCVAFRRSTLGCVGVVFPDGAVATAAGMCRLGDFPHARR